MSQIRVEIKHVEKTNTTTGSKGVFRLLTAHFERYGNLSQSSHTPAAIDIIDTGVMPVKV